MYHVLNYYKGAVEALAATPDGELLASAHQNGTVRLWKLPSPARPATLTGHRRGVSALAVTPDSQLLASAGWDQTVRLWKLPSGAPAGILTDPRDKSVLSDFAPLPQALVVTPDGRLLVSAIGDRSVRLWQLWSKLLHTPIQQLTPGDLEHLRSSAKPSSLEHAWAELISALMNRCHRHDIEVADGASVIPAGTWDIELESDDGP